MPGTYQLHLRVLMFYFDLSCECTFKCICVGLCENIIYGKLCSCGPQQRQTPLLPSLTTNSTLPGPRSSHSTVPIPCEYGKECQEERQERALAEWAMNPFTSSFPLIDATSLRTGYHYTHIIAEESQGGSLWGLHPWHGMVSQVEQTDDHSGQPEPFLCHGPYSTFSEFLHWVWTQRDCCLLILVTLARHTPEANRREPGPPMRGNESKILADRSSGSSSATHSMCPWTNDSPCWP